MSLLTLPQLEDKARMGGFDLSLSHLEKAKAYLEMLLKWNKAYNLTAVTDPSLVFERHWLDSLSIAKFLSGQSVIDVGTGAGLPGIPLAVNDSSKNFCLLDSNTKRQIFLQQVVHKLELSHVMLHCGRSEHYHVEKKFDCIVSRAFKSLPEFLQLTKHLLNENGRVLAMKGLIDHNELSNIPQDFEVEDVIPLTTSEHEKTRHLIIVKHKQDI